MRSGARIGKFGAFFCGVKIACPSKKYSDFGWLTMQKIFLAICFCLFFVGSAVAAPSRPAAYRDVVFTPAVRAMDGFSISFPADEHQCRAAYGKKWRENCAATLGMPGKEEKNITLTPAVPGTWRWQDGSTLVFRPKTEDAIKPATSYGADLNKLFVPSFIKLANSKAVCKTPFPSARLVSSDFWIDPDPKGLHRLTAVFEFNYPRADKNLPQLQSGKDLRFGKPEAVWNANGSRLNISWPVTSLPRDGGYARIHFADLGRYEDVNGETRFYAPVNGGSDFSRSISGAKELFRIRDARMLEGADSGLNREFILSLETTLFTEPDKIRENLSVWELPEKNSEGANRPYDWNLAPAISAEVLGKSRKLPLFVQEQGNAPRSRFSFSLPAAKGRYLLLTLKKDLTSASGEKLAKPFSAILKTPDSQADLAFLQPGNILPLNGSGNIGIYSRDIDKINWKLEKVREPFLALLAGLSDSHFGDGDGFPAFEMMSVVEEGEIPVPPAGEGKASFSSLPLGEIHKKLSQDCGGPLRITLYGSSKGKNVAETSRLVIPTNFAIIAKKGVNADLHCFISEIDSGEPGANVDALLLGANGLPVAQARTDGDGHAILPDPASLKREKRPVAIIAKRGDDLAWLPLDDRSREPDYGQFVTGGNHVAPNDLNIYAFGQRGVYRPGEEICFGILSRAGNFDKLPAGLPLHAEIIDPRGVKLWRQTFQPGENGLASLRWQSPETAPSGKYIFNVRQSDGADVLATTSCRIENFAPETLKMKIMPPAGKAWLSTKDNPQANFQVEMWNLYGTPGIGNRVRASYQVFPAVFAFPQYPGYVFTDANPFLGESETTQLPETVTDAEGKAQLSLPLQAFANVSGRLAISGEGFENGGGRAVISSASLLVSPMEKILGFRPGGNLANPDFILKDAPATVSFIAVDPDLKPVAWEGLRFALHRKTYATSLISDGAGGYRYDDVPIRQPLGARTLNLPVGGLDFPLATGEAGEFILVVEDDAGKQLAQFPYNVAGNEPRLPNERLTGSKIRLTLDKSTYNAGDEIRCSLSLPYDASGLLTIEREGVEHFSWFRAKAGESLRTIAIPETFEGQGYVSVVVKRDAESDAIYMDPLGFAVVPFTANIERRNLKPIISAPEAAAPGQMLEVEIKAQKPGDVIVVAVDEGILLLDAFQSPDPLAALLGNRALDVRTLQTIDLIMPDEKRISTRFSPFGGGMAGASFGTRFQNPFKRRSEPPLVFWSGVLRFSGEPLKVSLPVPEYYAGNLKIMAVMAGDDGCGSNQAEVKITAPLIMRPHLPLAVAPGDVFEGAITLENASPGQFAGKLEINLPPSLKALEPLPDHCEVASGATLLVPLKLEAGQEPGEAEISFKTQTPHGLFKRAQAISIRPVTTLRQTLKTGRITENGLLEAKRQLYPANATTTLTLDASSFPLQAAYATYLETYPYGCAEQLISRAFGQLVLADPEKRAAELALRSKAIEIIRERGSYGGLTGWPGSEPDLLLTIYGLDYLVTLAEKGYGANADLLEMLAYAVENNCALNESSLDGARVCAYGLWVLTRAGRITTRHLENLENAMRERGLDWTGDVTAALMNGAKKEMRLNVPAPVSPEYQVSNSWLNDFAQQALFMTVMARYFPQAVNADLQNGFQEAAMANINQNAYATFSSLQGLRALRAMENSAQPALAEIRVKCLDEDSQGEWLNDKTFSLPVCKAFQVDNVTRPLFWQIRQEGYDKVAALKAEANGLSLGKRLLDKNGEPVASVSQGDIVTVQVWAATEDGKKRDCVISDLLPGGFEMLFPSPGSDAALLEKCDFLDRQEDRMLIFAPLDGDAKIFEWKIRAVTPGSFTIPPASVEDMANRSFYANTDSGSLKVAP